EDLTVTFPGAAGPLHLVGGISLSLGQGEMVGIAGESGSGKTMTAMAIAGLIPYPGKVGGSIQLVGCDLVSASPPQRSATLADNLAVVFQDPMSSLNPALTIGRQMTEAVTVHGKMTRKAALSLAADHLRDLN